MNKKVCLVIVESPTKAKTIRKFLPKNFLVEASMGHVRDLPQSAAEIPKSVKEEEWSKIGVNVDKDFEVLYVVPKGKSKIVQNLKTLLKEADELYLATDEDREGESISWHLLQLLKPKVPVKRMVFHEITKSAIEKAIDHTREIDQQLVQSQEARRILDRLVGYTISPVIWKKIAYGLSAGRVQSAGLRLIVERERQRMRFVRASYHGLQVTLEKNGQPFEGKLISVSDKRIATGKDFGEETGKLTNPDKVFVLEKEPAEDLLSRLKKEKWVISSVEEKTFQSKPTPPFITSTLQQESNRKLGLGSKDTMRIAQRLYEEGLITYMRTDSPNLSAQALEGARAVVQNLYGKDYLSPEPRQFTSKKGAQEAHEAIRPAGSEFVHPSESGLSGKELALYELIWKRTVASQMAEAKKLSVSVRIQAGEATFSASGTRILFPGFLRAYVEGTDDPEAALEDKETLLPELKEKDVVQLDKIDVSEHETQPPARYTEASLVQTLEKEEIGRPSTYASIIGTLQDRAYVRKEGNALVPTFTGVAVIQLLEKHFDPWVDLSFTSEMEKSLDQIAEGKLTALPYLKAFYHGKKGLREWTASQEKKIDPNESRSLHLLGLKGVEVKIGRYGAYLVQGEQHASIPEDVAPADLTPQKALDILEASKKGNEPLGKHPTTGEPIYCLLGRYGPYVQQGEATDENPKPRRAGVPKEISPKDITLEQALKLLSLPRDLGIHPETGKPVAVNVGRFGPYVMHDGDYRSLKKDDNVYTVELSRALEILKEEKKGRGGSKLVKDLGNDPKTGKKIGLYDGKYGLYVKQGTKNASIPKETKPEDVTLEQAVQLLAERKSKKK